MKNFIPLIILALLVILISVAVNNLSNKQSDNATSSAKNLNDNSEESDDDMGEDFKKVEIDLPDFEVSDLFEEGKVITKKDLIGKYSLVNFFASWCYACLKEHDMLLRIQQEGIADLYGMAWRDIDNRTIDFLKRHGNPYIRVGADNKGIFKGELELDGVPETWLINPEGKVVLKFEGNLQEYWIEDIRRYIKSH